MKKVLIVMPSMNMGGAEKSLVSFLNMLDKDNIINKDIAIDLLIASKNGVLIKQIPKSVNIIKCPVDLESFATPLKVSLQNKSYNLKEITLKVSWFIQKRKLLKDTDLSENELYWNNFGKKLKTLGVSYDIAIAYMNGMATYYVIDKVRAKRKIVWVHNELEKLNYNLFFQKRFYESSNAIVTISDLCAQSILKHYPEFRPKLKVIENISSQPLINNLSKAFYPEEYNNTSCFKILSIGRIVEQKGYDIGILAMKKLKEKGYKFRWFIMGSGNLQEKLQNQISKHLLNNEIMFIGERENPYPYLKECNVFFQPSRYEGKSIALDEAKILNKPIVVAAYDTVYDSIENEKTGIICNLDGDSLALGLIRIMQSEELQSKLKVNLLSEKSGNESEIKKYNDLIMNI